MKPLFVLVLVLVALGVLFFALSNLDSGSSTGTIEPGPPKVAEDAPPAAASNALVDPGQRVEDVAEAAPAPAPDRTGIQGEGFENRLVSRVTDASGEAVPEATITLTRAGGMAMMFVNSEQDRSGDRKATTRKDGGFAFENVEPYAHYTLEVDHADYSRAIVEEVNVGVKGVFEEPTIVLTNGVALTGYIRDENGAGISEAVLHLGPMFLPTQGEPAPGSQTAQTDNLGLYKIENIAPGHRALRVEADGFGNAVVTGLSFQNTDQERDVTLEVAEMICGIVVGPGNVPIVGAEVLALSFSNKNQQCQDVTTTGEDGRFCLEKLSPGKYTIAVRAQGYKAGRGDREDTGKTDLLIEMQPQAVLRGKVIDAATGEPVASFRLTLRTTYEGEEQTSKTDIRSDVKNPDGEFELSDIPQGSYVVEAESAGYAPSFSEPFRVNQGQLVAGVVVRANKGGSISGTVVDSAGNPVRRAVVETFDNEWTGNEFDQALGDLLPSNVTRRQVRTGGDGSFKVDLLKGETYQLRIKAPDLCEHVQGGLIVKEGQDFAVGTIALIRGGSVGGIVLDPAGGPAEGATVRLNVNGRTNDIPRFYQTKTNAEGSYSFSSVFPGNYKVTASPRMGATGDGDFLSEISSTRASEQNVTVVDGQVYTIELKLGG